MGSVNEDWETLFSKYDILKKVNAEGRFQILADQIKELHEPRLMTKFDHHDDLPEIFQKNKLAILPISRSEYVISNFKAYRRLPLIAYRVKRFSYPTDLRSIDPHNITSEQNALTVALDSGITADFLSDSSIHLGTEGKSSSGAFDFDIFNTAKKANEKVSVANSQIEIDQAYDGERSTYVFEAKMALDSDFLVRQLYYPYRALSNLIKDKASIFLVYFVYSNRIFRLFKYKVGDQNNYNSLVFLGQKNYSFEDYAISKQDIADLLDKIKTVEEPDVAFPQADTFERVIDLVEYAGRGNVSNEEITDNYEFTSRQSFYYGDAGIYLGLLKKDIDARTGFYAITDIGKLALSLPYRESQLFFARLILSHRVFRLVLELYFKKNEMPAKGEVASLMKQEALFNIGSDSTFERRAQTILAWVRWIIGLFQTESEK